MNLLNLWLSFIAGVFAPLTAVCVLPLYPGFLAYLSTKGKHAKPIYLGLLVTMGVVASMAAFGLIFTFFLQESLTKAIGVISPIAFGVLAIVSIFLILDFDISRFMPKMKTPIFKNPYISSFLFGFFFGAIVLPCNPASLIVLFALSTSTVLFLTNFLNFLAFGIGMGLPLLIFAAITKSSKIINFISERKKIINRIAGGFMLGISLYYLFYVFEIHHILGI